MAVTGRGDAVFVGGAAIAVAGRDAVQVGADDAALRLGQEAPAGGAGHLGQGDRGGDLQGGAAAIRFRGPGPLPAQRHRVGADHRVVDDGADHLAADDGRGHAAEQRHAPGEVGGAVHRVDHEGEIGATERAEQGGIGGGGLLADHGAAGEGGVEGGGDAALGGFVGLGDEVERAGLLADVGGTQAAEARHDLGRGGVAQDAGEGIEPGHREFRCHARSQKWWPMRDRQDRGGCYPPPAPPTRGGRRKIAPMALVRPFRSVPGRPAAGGR